MSSVSGRSLHGKRIAYRYLGYNLHSINFFPYPLSSTHGTHPGHERLQTMIPETSHGAATGAVLTFSCNPKRHTDPAGPNSANNRLMNHYLEEKTSGLQSDDLGHRGGRETSILNRSSSMYTPRVRQAREGTSAPGKLHVPHTAQCGHRLSNLSSILASSPDSDPLLTTPAVPPTDTVHNRHHVDPESAPPCHSTPTQKIRGPIECFQDSARIAELRAPRTTGGSQIHA